MSDMYMEYTFKLCAYYGMKEVEQGNGTLHPRVETIFRYLKAFIKEHELENFYRKLIGYCKYLPNKLELHDVYQNLASLKDSDSTRKLIADASQNYAREHGVQYHPPAGTEGATTEDILKYDSAMGHGATIKRYGIRRSGEAWMKQVDDMTDQEYLEERHAELKKATMYARG